ncbi:hypothetical protein PIB30_057512 [Stylosanthes scabra]|uniref:Uncharacterized protein n=1 Tax=Stylosanthes scabra TaxID=79078 RepID=A0ABU6QJJ5_9FABA|nr:hypothetical protein [Stylosanthes scabra]
MDEMINKFRPAQSNSGNTSMRGSALSDRTNQNTTLSSDLGGCNAAEESVFSKNKRKVAHSCEIAIQGSKGNTPVRNINENLGKENNVFGQTQEATLSSSTTADLEKQQISTVTLGVITPRSTKKTRLDRYIKLRDKRNKRSELTGQGSSNGHLPALHNQVYNTHKNLTTADRVSQVMNPTNATSG